MICLDAYRQLWSFHFKQNDLILIQHYYKSHCKSHRCMFWVHFLPHKPINLWNNVHQLAFNSFYSSITGALLHFKVHYFHQLLPPSADGRIVYAWVSSYALNWFNSNNMKTCPSKHCIAFTATRVVKTLHSTTLSQWKIYFPEESKKLHFFLGDSIFLPFWGW